MLFLNIDLTAAVVFSGPCGQMWLLPFPTHLCVHKSYLMFSVIEFWRFKYRPIVHQRHPIYCTLSRKKEKRLIKP